MPSGKKKGVIGNHSLPDWFRRGSYSLMIIWFVLVVWIMWSEEQMGTQEWTINLLLAGLSAVCFGYGVLRRGSKISWDEQKIRVLNRSKK